MSTVITEHPNVTTVRGFYDALKAGDVEALKSLLSPEASILVPGNSRLAGRYDGRDAVFGFVGSMKAATDGNYRAQLMALYSSDAQAIAIHHGTGTRGEMTLDAEAALVFDVSDGVITAISVFQRDQDHWDGFFA